MERLLLGITLTLYGLNLLDILTISAKFLGILFLITGIVYIIVSIGIAVPQVPKRRVE